MVRGYIIIVIIITLLNTVVVVDPRLHIWCSVISTKHNQFFFLLLTTFASSLPFINNNKKKIIIIIRIILFPVRRLSIDHRISTYYIRVFGKSNRFRGKLKYRIKHKNVFEFFYF